MKVSQELKVSILFSDFAYSIVPEMALPGPGGVLSVIRMCSSCTLSAKLTIA